MLRMSVGNGGHGAVECAEVVQHSARNVPVWTEMRTEN